MLKNYLKIAIRNLLKFKAYSFINVLGLCIGMSSCLIILLYVLDELSFDSYHENSEQIYRVVLEKFEEGTSRSRTWAPISPGYGPKLREEFSAVQQSARFWPWEFGVFEYNNRKYVEDNFVYAESSVKDIFSYRFISGDPNTALTDPNTVILTESMAQKYFANSDPVGKVVKSTISETGLKVTAVIEDLPENSHFSYDFIVSFTTWETKAGRENLTFMGGDFNYPTYLLLEEDTDIDHLTSQFPAFLDRNMAEINGRKPHDVFEIHLQPLDRIYLHSNFDSDYATTGSITYVYIFSAIAFLVLLIACVNFINLSTARSIRRAQEVGVRKVLGAFRFQLIRQFLAESALFALLALLLAIVTVEIVLPYFNAFTGKELNLDYATNSNILVVLLSLILFVGCAAGSYPAFVLSGFRPIGVLKGGETHGGSRASRLRSTLVVLQFVISIALLISVVVIQKQLNFVQIQNLGFNKEHIVSLPASREIVRDLETIKNELKQNPGILNVSASSRVPSGFLNDAMNALVFKNGELIPTGFRLPFVRIDHDFFDTFGMQIVAGRNFSRSFSSDSTEAFILNETAVAALGWSPDQAIDQELHYGRERGRVIGVVKDFHFESMHRKIKPMVFTISQFFRRISARVAPVDMSATLDFLRQKWQIYRPEYPFSYYFIDQKFDERYKAEEKLGSVFGIFSILAAFVAALGLFGLATFIAEQRTKEIGIRKVVGASAMQILTMLSNQFLKLALIANIFAWPIAYYFMRDWLDSFAYKTDMSLMVFFMAGVIAIVFAFMTVSYQSFRAARSNPIDALRYE